jgi:hypothetical protein
MCSLGANCKRPVCFFAHSQQELRVTPYSKLDTAAAVAAQQLPELGQELDPSSACHANMTASLLGASCGSIDAKIRPASSINSPGSSECGMGKHGGSSATSATDSLSVDDAAALAQLTASMAALGSPAAPLLDVGGMALRNTAYLAAAAAAVDASTSGSADMAVPGAGLWQLAGTGVQPYGSAAFVQQPMLDPQVLPNGALAPAGAGDVWLMPSPAANPQWPAVSAAAAAAARNMLVQQQQQQQRSFGLSAAPPAAACTAGLAPGLPIPSLLGNTALSQWLQLDGLQPTAGSGCYPLQAGLRGPTAVACNMVQRQQQQAVVDGNQAQAMQQLINQQAMQQLLGLLDAQAAH